MEIPKKKTKKRYIYTRNKSFKTKKFYSIVDDNKITLTITSYGIILFEINNVKLNTMYTKNFNIINFKEIEKNTGFDILNFFLYNIRSFIMEYINLYYNENNKNIIFEKICKSVSKYKIEPYLFEIQNYLI